MLLAMLAAWVQTAFAQTDSRDYNRSWYAGLSGGTSFGQATFRSITESKTHVGAQAVKEAGLAAPVAGDVAEEPVILQRRQIRIVDAGEGRKAL